MNELFRDIFRFLPQPWQGLAMPLIVFLVVIVAGLILRRILFSRLRTWSQSTSSRVDDIIVDALFGPSLFWVAMAAIHTAAEVSPLPRDLIARVEQLMVALWIIAVTTVMAKLAGRLVGLWGARDDGSSRMGTLGEVIASLLVALLGVLTLLNAFGISITPMLTALGVGGLAVALALQDTLSNFFAGFYLSLAGQVRVGDFVKLETGQEGFVADIGWRTVSLRERPNNLIVIPNNKFAQAIVTNYHLPERRTSVLISVGVSYDEDPHHVERVLVDIASNIEIPGLLKDPTPFVRFIPGFGEYSLNFTLICQIADINDNFLVQHEIRKEIIHRFRREGITIPFPTRTVEHKSVSGEATDHQ